jgi:hypothetical protein
MQPLQLKCKVFLLQSNTCYRSKHYSITISQKNINGYNYVFEFAVYAILFVYYMKSYSIWFLYQTIT